ncbi:MAG TPA: carbohydrate ABC transporter permease, partial [Propionibacteriaceae bacterium]|nr:carbohydrate ABC transporter permease [Propionibacteriaceae bacterium]
LLSTMMIPGEVLLIPQFVLFRNLGWIDTLLPIIVPNFFANAYNVFLMRQFITRIPVELSDAAMIDGLGRWGIFRRIVLPLMRPILFAVAIFTFTFNWGYFFGPLIYINSEEKMPLALGVQILSATTSG